MALIAFASKANSQIQLPVVQFDMNEFMAHQAHQQQANEHQREHHNMHMNEQGRDAEGMRDPIVGYALNPLDPLNVLHPFHPLNPSGLGIPGLRFNKFSIGKFGNTMYSNSLLGAENPMAEGDPQLESHHHHHHLDAELAAPQHYQMEPQMEHELAAAQPQEFHPFHHWHFANPNDEVGAAQQMHMEHMQHMMPMEPQAVGPMQMQHFELAAPQMQQMEMQPVGPPMHQMEMQQMHQAEQEARTFWNKGGDYG